MAKRIDIQDLDVYYGDFKAVEGVTMTVEPRSVTAFIGPSGCGKSTVLRTLNRMHEVIPGGHVKGKILLDDTDLYAAGQDRVYATEKMAQITIPRAKDTTSGANFEILVGFDVTPQMAAFNREGKRFRLNAGAAAVAAAGRPTVNE